MDTALNSLLIRPATTDDATALATLVNRAYRGESSRTGWTTEADLLDGVRTTPEQIAALAQQANTCLLTGWRGTQLLGSVCAEWHPDAQAVHLGMIAIEPTQQNQGLGKTMIAAAEQMAVTRWHARHAHMAVISRRQTLLAFYQRLGYLATGEARPFPEQPRLWQARVKHLQLITLQKTLPAQASYTPD